MSDAAGSYLEASNRATNGVKQVLAQIWGGILVLIGILIFVLVGADAWWAGLLLAYGAYLIVPSKFLPFRKIVIW
ncbi:hypothetical protein [Litorihabitans aurantiacus]|uniref:Uncharacterized protein n=1 Tax=Litorihabitans aurantiacus TaxID=1930061 RepID=A0AA37XH87_9MICO|nr:hypothetical protein [Litorihabitans aurantiacus]GMA33051.1 hypothetical protein GCM10025875_30430 [Litorihabitans aurantiacus]